jgi:transcriptional regulator with XRE-family HTH domain
MDKPETPSEVFPDRLRQARRLRALDQVELAARTGLQPSAISHFEGGARKPSFENLRRLATALEVSTDFLLGRVDEPEADARADPLYRHLQNLSTDDRELARAFLDLLAMRRQAAAPES